MSKVFNLLILLLSSTAFGKWSPAERNYANNVSISEPSYISTARANCWARGFTSLETEHLFARERFNSSSTKFPVEFDILIPIKNSKFFKTKYNIVHIFPGIFGNTDDGIIHVFIEQVLAAGNIAAVYPNPLSLQYLKSIPKKISTGNLEEEADFFKKLVFEAENRIQARLPDSKKQATRVLGLSYGAFISSILSAKINKTHPNFISELVLFSPPLEMKSTLAFIDKSLGKIEKEFTNFPIINEGAKIWKVCSSNIEDYGIYRPTAKRMVLHLGFLDSLSKVVMSFMENRGEDNFWWYPFRLMTDDFYEWKKSLSFSKIINEFKLHRTKTFLSSEKASLSYWVNPLSQKSKTKIKIFSTKDDFLNTDNSWKSLNISKESLVMTERGGHLGFLDRQSFANLLKQIYSKN